MTSPSARECVFALASMQNADSARAPLSAFALWLDDRADAAVSTRFLDGYRALAASLRDGTVDLAWLPPVVFVMLQKLGVVEALVSNHRAGHAAMHSVLVVQEGARIHTLDGLRGTRAAWVDPYSATGYVVPRLQLAAFGVDPRSAFKEQRFHGSHDAVLEAVAFGAADVAGTFARVDGTGIVSSGSWSNLPRLRSHVRVLATFGEIPADVIAVRAGLDPALTARLADAFVASANEALSRELIKRLFGVDEFRRGNMKSYTGLRIAVEQARNGGLLEDLAAL